MVAHLESEPSDPLLFPWPPASYRDWTQIPGLFLPSPDPATPSGGASSGVQEPELEEQLPQRPARLWMVSSTLDSAPRPSHTDGRKGASSTQEAQGQRKAELPERRPCCCWVDLGAERAEECWFYWETLMLKQEGEKPDEKPRWRERGTGGEMGEWQDSESYVRDLGLVPSLPTPQPPAARPRVWTMSGPKEKCHSQGA